MNISLNIVQIDEKVGDLEKIIVEDIPLIDVRAPIEFEKGAFINSVNMPIMNDEERHLVGVEYKKKGPDAATILGHKLVSGTEKEARVKGWADFIEENPNSIIYCFRGGQRSQISQQWVYEATGKVVPRIDGGYKKFRNYLIDCLTSDYLTANPILLDGCTGAGKTILLNKLENSIDFEAIANHRGSSFGRNITGQPSQIDFENNLAYAAVKHKSKGFKTMIVESEGKHVGANYFPKTFLDYLSKGKLVILEASLEKRVENTLNEYVESEQKRYIVNAGEEEQGLKDWYEYIEAAIKRLEKRMGNGAMQEVINMVEYAYSEQLRTGKLSSHEGWLEVLLRDYYDPMYRHQIKNNQRETIFIGNEEEVIDFFKNMKQ